jgi:hypothetical protein
MHSANVYRLAIHRINLEISAAKVENLCMRHQPVLWLRIANPRWVIVLLTVVALLLADLLTIGSSQIALAQNGSPDPAVIASQLRAASVAGRKALQGLQSLPADDAMPIPPQVLKDATETYGWIRAARHGMELKKQADKYPDPTMDLAFKRLAEAADCARAVVDKASWGGNRAGAEYLSVAIPNSKRALQLVNQTLLFFP